MSEGWVTVNEDMLDTKDVSVGIRAATLKFLIGVVQSLNLSRSWRDNRLSMQQSMIISEDSLLSEQHLMGATVSSSENQFDLGWQGSRKSRGVGRAVDDGE
jgi:hypothetical protein